MPTIGQLAGSVDDLSILVDVLGFINSEGAGDLAPLLDSEPSLTVFAPTNAAFGQLAKDLGFPGDAENLADVTEFLTMNVPATTLATIVKYHVSAGEKNRTDLESAGTIATLSGDATIDVAFPRLRDNEPDLIDPSIVATVEAPSNGIVYLIDRVLLPIDLPDNDVDTIAGIVASSGNGFDGDSSDFDMLKKAVEIADPSIGALLSDESQDLTALAPTDAAFVSLAQDLGYDGEDEGGAFDYIVDALTVLSKGDPIALLNTVLGYHVAEPSLQKSQVEAIGDAPIETFVGAPIFLNGTELVDLDPDAEDPMLVATDIQAANGVVHVIDEVLRPADLPDGEAFKILDDGNNHLRGSRNDDYVLAKGGRDSIFARNGDDVVLAGDGNDRVFGGRGDDHIDGGAGRDHLVGGRGDDTIDGGEGNDKLFGGSGADTFVFNEMSGHDTIIGFRGNDKIDLTAFGLDGIEDVDITGRFFSTKIEVEDTTISLTFVNANSLSEDDFIF